MWKTFLYLVMESQLYDVSLPLSFITLSRTSVKIAG